mmetsp:Transcript_29406/g.70821  ORF Transcript_29406/g.70821 Transcript_29406/m.70821 type:complete len:202 (-) Transcript_29406:78-683(-)
MYGQALSAGGPLVPHGASAAARGLLRSPLSLSPRNPPPRRGPHLPLSPRRHHGCVAQRECRHRQAPLGALLGVGRPLLPAANRLSQHRPLPLLRFAAAIGVRPPRRQADPPSLEVPRRTVTGRLVCPPPPPPARPHARPCLGPRLPPDPAPARGVRGVAEGEGGSELPADGVYSRTLRTRGVPSKPQRGDPSPRRRRFRVE